MIGESDLRPQPPDVGTDDHPEEFDGKSIALDVLAEDHPGQRHTVEMQTRPFPAWSVRSVY